MNIKLTQKIRKLAGDLDTPISLYLKIAGDNMGILLESAEVDGRWGRYSVVAAKYLLEITCAEGRLRLKINDARLRPLAEFEGMPFEPGLKALMRVIELKSEGCGNSLPAITRGLYGYLGYGMAGVFQPKLAPHLPASQGEACLVLPGELVLFDHLYNQIFHLSLLDTYQCPSTLGFSVPKPPEIGPISVSPNKEEYMATAAEIKNLIHRGEAMRVVASIRYSARIEGSPFEIYRNLRAISPSPYMFFMQFDNLCLLGSSPEALVHCADGKLSLSPVAGARPRGSTRGEDNLFEEELAEDPREKAEHVLLVDLGRNDLTRVAEAGSVKVERFMEVEKFSHVMHLTSYLSARLKKNLDSADIVAATFPSGSVSGAPKINAMKIAAEKESSFSGLKSGRGPYAGAIGWLGLDKHAVNMDLGLTIRSLWARNGSLNWQAGAGITYDSDPENEWNKCQNKANAVLSAIEHTPAQQENREEREGESDASARG